MAPIFEVRISGEVQFNGGVRHRHVTLVDGSTRLLEFGTQPVFLDGLPQEVDEDLHLLVKEVTAEHVRTFGGVVLSLKPERVQDGDDPPRPPPVAAAAAAMTKRPTSAAKAAAKKRLAATKKRPESFAPVVVKLPSQPDVKLES
jgi:hypothetical protein